MSVNYQEIKEYYGETLHTNEDLKTNACCTMVPPPEHIAKILANIHDEVHAKYYGCGLTIPNKVKGLSILDLGSGSGRDCFVASALVGERGSVTGVDMTDQQLDVANKYIDYHTEKFGFQKSNTRFVKGNIDELGNLDFPDKSFDVIISNCVINLSKNKQKVLHDAFKLLKPGGEMYFSDVYSDRRIPMHLQNDPVLWGECLSGALYWNDFHRYAIKAGFIDPRVVSSEPLIVENREVKDILGDIQFQSITYRLFKIEGLESSCEDFGQAVEYKGTIAHNPSSFELDDHHLFPKGKIVSVCGNTYKMLHETRFKEDFAFYGSWEKHFGIFEGCGEASPFNENSLVDGGTAGCC